MKKSAFRFYIINFILGFLIFGIIAFLVIVTQFTLNKVDYSGVKHSDSYEIRDVLFADKLCGNSIYAWFSNLLGSHPDIPFVKEAKVYLKDKNTVVVDVTEKEIAGVAEQNGENVYFDFDGKITEINDRHLSDIPVLLGANIGESVVGEYLAIPQNQRNNLCDILKTLSNLNITPSSIKFDKDGTGGFSIGEVFVDLGVLTNVKEKCQRLPQILPEIQGINGTLHLEEWSRQNTDIVFEKTY